MPIVKPSRAVTPAVIVSDLYGRQSHQWTKPQPAHPVYKPGPLMPRTKFLKR